MENKDIKNVLNALSKIDWKKAFDKCTWTLEKFGEYWETSCKRSFTFIEGNPTDNNYIYCPGCGKVIE